MNGNKRVGVFVDVQNLYHAARSIHGGKVDYQKLLSLITAERTVVRAIAYLIHKPEVEQRSFCDALSNLGYELKIKEAKVRQTDEFKQYKGSWHVGMTVDIMVQAQKLDVVALITGDGDFLPLVQHIQSLGCKVEIYGYRNSTSKDLLKFCDKFVELPREMVVSGRFKPEGIPHEDETPDNNGLGIFGEKEETVEAQT